MAHTGPTLHLLCGKIAAGKSTLAKQLADAPGTVLIAEDTWLARLYPGEISELRDYVRCSGRLAEVMAPHVTALLEEGLSVVLDFPANTPAQRQRLRAIFELAGAEHCLHFLDVPDAVCKARLRQRNASGTHDFQTTDEQFDQITSYFVPPSDDEGFNILVYTAD